MMHFLFGYGSLINSSSRAVTGQTGETYSVWIRGFKREWNVPAHRMKFTGVGVVPEHKSLCNGVVTKIKEEDLPLFDEREIAGSSYRYERVLIPIEKIDGDTPIGKNVKIWCYVVKQPEYASRCYPIVQSYVDVILAGCLEYGEDFANAFVIHTAGWNYPWINDRVEPIYVRSLPASDYKKIDAILAKNIPQEFALRKQLAPKEDNC